MAPKKPILNQEAVKPMLDKLYEVCLEGLPKISRPVEEVAEDYLRKNSDRETAAKAMIRNQVLKCTTTGAITGLGGIVVLPAAVTADVGSVMYLQMRMIACTAYIAGYDLNSDQVQAVIYACLAGVAINEIVKKAGIELGEKVFINIVKRIPGDVLVKINQKVGFRFVTKFGQKGLVNLGKLVPGVGMLISGGVDCAETRILGNRAYKWFFKNDFSIDNDPRTDDFVISPDEVDSYFTDHTGNNSL